MSSEEVLGDHAGHEHEDLLAVREFAALTVGDQRVVPLGAA